MKRILTLLLVLVAWAGGRALTVTDTIFDRAAHEKDFAFGADIGFVSQMESWGTKWLDKNGRQKDILQILKEQGINNIRLRVWTTSGFCGKNDVVNMCKRAKAKGMGVMIDFHYSDTWADPGSQTIPSAWTNMLCFIYNNNALRSSVLTLDADTLERKYFYARNNASSTTNVDIVQTGPQRVCLSAVTTKGLPSDITLRVFPLAGQMVPGEGLTDGVQLYEAPAGDAVVDIYSLSGRFVRRTTERQLGLSLGSRESAVVLLPNCVGGTPNIVRKVRLK